MDDRRRPGAQRETPGDPERIKRRFLNGRKHTPKISPKKNKKSKKKQKKLKTYEIAQSMVLLYESDDF